MMVGGLEAVFALLIGLLSIALPVVVLVMLFMIYNKLNHIERLLSLHEGHEL